MIFRIIRREGVAWAMIRRRAWWTAHGRAHDHENLFVVGCADERERRVRERDVDVSGGGASSGDGDRAGVSVLGGRA